MMYSSTRSRTSAWAAAHSHSVMRLLLPEPIAKRNTLPVNVLPAGPEHVEEIAHLASIIWRAHYPGIISLEQIDYMLREMYDLDVLRREMAEDITFLRLLVGDGISGFASYGPAGKEMKLHKLYIHPDCQRQGLGRALLEHVES